MTDYEEARNKLIPEAEKYADGMAGLKPGKENLSVNARKKAWEIWNGAWITFGKKGLRRRRYEFYSTKPGV